MNFLRKKWKIVLVVALAVPLFIFVGVFASFYGRAVENENLLNALKYIESGSMPDPTPAFKARVEMLKGGGGQSVAVGAYKNVSQHAGITYDSAMVLKGDGSYSFAMSVGDGRVHKTYQHFGKWWVEGSVFSTVLLGGDDFLASPEARDMKTAMHEIIVESGEGRLVLQAHYNSEPVVFKLEK